MTCRRDDGFDGVAAVTPSAIPVPPISVVSPTPRPRVGSPQTGPYHRWSVMLREGRPAREPTLPGTGTGKRWREKESESHRTLTDDTTLHPSFFIKYKEVN